MFKFNLKFKITIFLYTQNKTNYCLLLNCFRIVIMRTHGFTSDA